jgi:predicted nuclease with TOPRIM domain
LAALVSTVYALYSLLDLCVYLKLDTAEKELYNNRE